MTSWRLRALFESQLFSHSDTFRRHCFCLPLLALLCLLASATARAQDIFSAKDLATFNDTFSTSCMQSHPQTVWRQKNVDPLTCHAGQGLQNPQGGCTLYSPGATVIAHIGTQCYYCTPNNPPGQIYIAADQGANAQKQGYTCGDPGIDPGCMLLCWKTQTGATVPPPPPSMQPTTGGGGPLTATAGYDPCHPNYDMSTPAGRAQAQANAAKDKAACDESLCQHNPLLAFCKTVSVTVSSAVQAVKNAVCQTDDNLPPAYLQGNEAATLEAALTNAKNMLTNAKKFTDKPQWDKGTQAIGVKYFGNASAATQTAIRVRIDNALALLSQMSLANQSFYPGSGDEPGLPPNTVAYVHPAGLGSHPVIFLTPLYWTMSATGPDSQASIIAHELSHFFAAGGTGDPAYGQGNCETLALNTDLLKALSAWRLPADPLSNASSFQYFVYYASQQ